MTWSAHDSNEALAFARHQHHIDSRAWEGMCLAFVRTAYGIPAKYPSAISAWEHCPPSHRFPGGRPYHAPVGAALCFSGGAKSFGHIMIAARDFPNGKHAAWSNDLVVPGRIDKVRRNAPVTEWGEHYLGYITQVNGVNLRLVS